MAERGDRELALYGSFLAPREPERTGGPPAAGLAGPPGEVMTPAGAFGRATGATSLAFVSSLSLQEGTVARYGLTKELSAVRGCRTIGKRDMKLNDALPRIEVDPETYVVTADGEILTAEAAGVLPLAQRYCLF